MTLARVISAGARAAIMILVGSALIAIPLGLGLSAQAVLIGVAAGAVTVGLGVSGTAAYGRGTLPVSVQAVYDRVLALVLLLTAIGFAAVGQDQALTLFGVAGATVLLTSVTTSYSFAGRARSI